MASYFPLSLRFDNKKVLLIGAGNIAAFKLEKIQQYNPEKIQVVAENFNPKFIALKNDNVVCLTKSFETEDLEGFDMVIVAIENQELQRNIYNLCKNKNILCNCVDLIDCCDFIFPSIIKRGDITVAINSNGVLPGFSAVLKTYLEQFLPPKIESKFYEIAELRKKLPSGPERMKSIRMKAQEYFDSLMLGKN